MTITPDVAIQAVNEEAEFVAKLLRRHPAASGASARLEVPGEDSGQDEARFLGDLQIHQVDIHGRAETASAAFVGDHAEAFRIEGRLDFTVRSLVDSARQASAGGRAELEQLASARPWISQLISESIGQRAPEGLKRFGEGEARRAPDRTIGAIVRELISDSVDAEARESVSGAIQRIVRATREEQGLVASRFLIAVALGALGLAIAALTAFGSDSMFLTLDPSDVGGWKSILTIIGAVIWALAAWSLYGRRMERFHRRVAAPSEPNGARREAIRQEKTEARVGLILLCGITAGHAAFMNLAPPWPINPSTGSAETLAVTEAAIAEAQAAAAAAAEAAANAARPEPSPQPMAPQGEMPEPELEDPRYGQVEGTPSGDAMPSETSSAIAREAPPLIISNPSWVRPPPIEFPERAASRGISAGEVRLSCRVTPSGAVTDCSIISESPADVGFGGAALNGARRARVRPREVNGEGVGSGIEFTVRFAQAPD